ncbi:hypothetical protein QOZ80_5AG0377760 [Eleusine coracana subsp. coracana]|nr:hypothetical protein QOZ80_5AG0377760 [Eleusine coracana subsp. coracana]
MAVNSSSTGSGQFRLDCGASTTKDFDSDDRAWNSDNGSRFAPSLKGFAATASDQDPAPPSNIPYMTTRIFTSNYTYSFAVPPGRMFVRLYIYPSTYDIHAPSSAYFGVAANNLVFLNNFSASQITLALKNVGSFVHEYSINVTSGRLELTFSPSTYPNGSYAFVNGIEIIPTPDLFTTPIMPTLASGLNPIPLRIDPATGFQTMYRLNVGGEFVSPQGDVEFYRAWHNDTPHTTAACGVTFVKDSNVTITYTPGVPNYTAPVDVYASARSMGSDEQINLNYNLTWIFPVDAGFYYLVRLHFCEIQYAITKLKPRPFFIYINNQTAHREMDVLVASGGIGRIVYKDYVTVITGFGQVDLLVELHPSFSTTAEYHDAILNGLEIFKLQSYEDDSLAALNTPRVPKSETSGGRRSKTAARAAISGAAGGAVVVIIACISVCIFCQQKTKAGLEYATTVQSITPIVKCNMVPSNICCHFTFKEIQAATSNFDESFLLGKGGFGNVYSGMMDRGIKVAIKRGNPLSQQGLHEFRTEIETLSLLRHRHLVSLIGYCEENNEMILVYDYMASGTLREHLYNTKRSPLPWKQRLEICIGAAQGLHYLHSGAKQTIIHRDVKTANILLDDKLAAKVSDFGLSKASLDINDTHVSTIVKGTFGYLDPEYFRRKQLTQKSDVYSFGVV